MKEPLTLEARAADLRAAFDGSFALPPVQTSGELEDLLVIRVAGVAYAIRLREVAGVVARRKVIAVPSTRAHLLGIAGIRGEIVPVFSLASILGHGSSGDSARWMVLHQARDLIGLAFSDFEGHLRVPKSSLHAEQLSSTSQGSMRELARTETAVLSVIGMPAVCATLGVETALTG